MGTIFLGLGSILGTGVFVTIGVAAGVAGPSVLAAIVLAAGLAACNALSSAQLAAQHPVSGGTYEYAHRLVSPTFGFIAGWVFLAAKTASAATAALGAAGYLLRIVGIEESAFIAPLAFALAAGFTLLTASGLRRSSAVNGAIVLVVLLALLTLVVCALPRAIAQSGAHFTPFLSNGFDHNFFYATALMFVAFAGFARVATLGEDVVEPHRTIPRAIIITLVVSAGLYVLVAFAAIGAVGARSLAQAAHGNAAPLEAVARALSVPWLAELVAIGAIAALLGVVLNLLLGLSRVALAMGRRGEMPAILARISIKNASPTFAIIAVGAVVSALTWIGDIEVTWAFSAFSILLYYAITNLATLCLPESQRRYPRAIAIIGLSGCVFLAAFVPWKVWAIGLGFIVIGVLWRRLALSVWGAQGGG